MVARRKQVQSKLETKLALLRERATVTQDELARATGLSPATIYRLEAGLIDNPRIRDLTNCALALGCELGDVIEEAWETWYPENGKRPPQPPDPAVFVKLREVSSDEARPPHKPSP